MLSMELPRPISSQLERMMRGKGYYLRRWMLASREGGKLFDVQLKRLASRHAIILSIRPRKNMGPLDIESVLKRRISREPTLVEVRYAGMRSNISIVTPALRIRLGHGVSPGPGDERQRRDDRLCLHGVLSSLPLYFPYPRIRSAVLRKENMRQPNAGILGFGGGLALEVDLLEFLKGAHEFTEFTKRTLGICKIRKEISRSAEVVVLTDGSPPFKRGFLVDNGA
jgi:hypothetical protein